MDFIERILGLSPDNGSGSFEMVIVAVAAAYVGYAAWRRRRAVARVRNRVLV